MTWEVLPGVTKGSPQQWACDHGRSWTGVDDTPLNAAVKRWRCDDCGHEKELPR